MAISKADREALMQELRNEMAAQRASDPQPQPQLPDVPELSLVDVLRVLVVNSRISSQTLQDQCLAAIDREFADETTEETVETDDSEVVNA